MKPRVSGARLMAASPHVPAERFLDLVLGLDLDRLDDRHGDRRGVRMADQAHVVDRLQHQSHPKDRQHERHDQLGRPHRQLDVDGRIAELPGPQEVEERRVDEDGDDDQRHEHAEQLHRPQEAHREAAQQQVHADMGADPLGIGDAEEGEQRARLLHVVDVAVDRGVEDRAPDDLEDADEHQKEDRRRGDQVHAVFQPRPITVRGRQRGRAVSHAVLPTGRSFAPPALTGG